MKRGVTMKSIEVEKVRELLRILYTVTTLNQEEYLNQNQMVYIGYEQGRMDAYKQVANLIMATLEEE